jgi:FkbM family methyltransferase
VRIFLDIGAHEGETLSVAKDERWRFDRIVCFEPAPACWPAIDALADSRVELARFGLWKQDDSLVLHNVGQIGASMSDDKDTSTGVDATCEFRDAGKWFATNLDPEDEVFAKINVEGAEADVVRRLAETGTLALIDHLMIHFDVRKVPSLRHREVECRTHLDAAGVDYQPAEDIEFGGVYRGTRNWLRWCEANPRTRDLRYKMLARWEHSIRRALYPVKQRLR